MRFIVGLSILILGLATVFCRIDMQSPGANAVPNRTSWVRTTDGWERPESWHADALASPLPHPLVVAAAQGMVSLFALLALDGRDRERTGC